MLTVLSVGLSFFLGFYLLLNQVKKLLFTGIQRDTLLTIIQRHNINIFALTAADCERINQFISLNQELKNIRGHSKNVDTKSPLITKADASKLKALCDEHLNQNKPHNTENNPTTTASQQDEDVSPQKLVVVESNCPSTAPIEDTPSKNVNNEGTSCVTLVPALQTVQAMEVKSCYASSPDPWGVNGCFADKYDVSTPNQNASNTSLRPTSPIPKSPTPPPPMHSSLNQADGESLASMDLSKSSAMESYEVAPSKRKIEFEDPDYTPDSEAKRFRTPQQKGLKMRKAKTTPVKKVTPVKVKLAKQKSSWYIKKSQKGPKGFQQLNNNDPLDLSGQPNTIFFSRLYLFYCISFLHVLMCSYW